MSAAAAALVYACAVAAEPLELVCRGHPAVTAVRAVEGVVRQPHRLGPDLADRAQQPVWFAVRQGDATQLRQALAWALDTWYARAGDGAWVFSQAPRLQPGPQAVWQVPTTSRADAATLVVLRTVLDPWLGGDGQVTSSTSATYTAILDEAGRTRMEQLVTLIDRGQASVPHLVELAPPALPTARGATWADWLQVATIALAPGYDQRTADIQATVLAWHAEVLCVGSQTPGDRRHPAEQAMYAYLPLDQLGLDADARDQLARQAAGTLPRWPGWGAWSLPHAPALLVAADPAGIHRCMDVIAQVDRGGLAALDGRH